MNNSTIAYLAIDVAGALRRQGYQVLGAHCINGRPWLKVAPTLTIAQRIAILAQAWASDQQVSIVSGPQPKRGKK